MQPAQAQPQASASPRKRWHDHPTVRFLTLIIVLWGLYWSYGYLSGPTRRTTRLNQTLRQQPPTVNLLVTTNFAPEAFHIQLYQDIGRLRGVTGKTAKLYDVTPDQARLLSRYYWIEQLDLAPAEP